MLFEKKKDHSVLFFFGGETELTRVCIHEETLTSALSGVNNTLVFKAKE